MVSYSYLSGSVEESVCDRSQCNSPNEIPPSLTVSEAAGLSHPPLKFTKQQIRFSLKASTWDGVFAAIFSSITSGVLLSNLLLELGANSMQIGMLFSIPMLVNLLQPIGAYFSELTTSRRWYGFLIYSTSRVLWLVLAIAIWFGHDSDRDKPYLLLLTWVLVIVSNLVAAFGNASWLSWMVWLVPERLRGRYFGFRNSAASLVTLLCVPLVGIAVSAWPGGTLQAYAAIFFIGAIAGLISMCCQFFMADVNPQWKRQIESKEIEEMEEYRDNFSASASDSSKRNNFFIFLLYFGFWTFAANVSLPFFNIYLLEDLNIDVSWAAVYTSLLSGANLLTMFMWGKLADRIGNRPILLLVGAIVAAEPFLWLIAGSNAFSIWIWLPFLFLSMGASWSAINLCNNNIQMSLASGKNQTVYFAIAAAAAGVGGALGATSAGFLAELANFGGLPEVFVLSGFLRYAALIPLLFVREHRSRSVRHTIRSFLPEKARNLVPMPANSVIDRSQWVIQTSQTLNK